MPPTDQLSLAGRVALITGANTGIGAVTARELARRGARVYLACRTPERARPVLEAIRADGGQCEGLTLDLGDLDSVRRCADAFIATGSPLHLLVNNAGLAGGHGFTASGFELAFGTNHVGHFLLTQQLRPVLERSAPARIVTVASRAHRRASGIDWSAVRQPTQSRTGLSEYSVSKLANILFSAELARQLRGTGVTTYSLHPGVVATEVWRSVPWVLRSVLNLFTLTPEQGARTSLHCATDPALAGETGRYYVDGRVAAPTPVAQDAQLAAQLWQRSLEWAA